MPQLPVLIANETIAAFERFGWKVARPGTAGQSHHSDQAGAPRHAFRSESQRGRARYAPKPDPSVGRCCR